MLILSSQSSTELKQYGQTEFDKQFFAVKAGLSNTIEIGDKNVNIIAVESKSGDTRRLVSDDARFPASIELSGNPFSVDIELLGIE